MGDTHFIKPVAPAPSSEPSELRNLHVNSAASLSQKNLQRKWNVNGRSGVPIRHWVSECVYVKGRLS